MDSLLQDLRYALRTFRRNPGFATIAVLTLALGIGANTTIFSAISTLLLNAMPFPEAERLAHVQLVHPNGTTTPATYEEFEAWRDEAEVFERAAAYTYRDFNLGGADGSERVAGYRVTPALFETLGVRPVLGRGFLPDEATPGSDRVVVLGQAVWERVFGGDPLVLNREVLIDGTPHTVVGVVSRAERFPPNADVWAPLALTPSMLESRSLEVVGRLRPGTTHEGATAALETVRARLAMSGPTGEVERRVRVEPLTKAQTAYQRTLLLILLGAVGFVLLIACANVASLLLARATARRQEIAIRASLGAGRGRIVRQLLTESVLLALAAGLIGTLLAVRAVAALRDAVPAELAAWIAGWDGLGVDPRSLAFTFCLAVVTGVAFGLAPALHAARTGLSGTLRDASRGSASRSGVLAYRALVSGEIALTLVLLVSAGLMVRSFTQILDADPGFRSENILTLEVALPAAEYSGGDAIGGFHDELLEQIRTLPGVRAAGLVSNLPMSRSGWGTGYAVEGIDAIDADARWSADWRPSSPGYLEALRIPLRHGRAFSDADAADGTRVAIVNETLARRHWPDTDPLGHRLVIGDDAWEIVGVVGDVSHYGLRSVPRAEIYVPIRQAPVRTAFLAIHTDGDPAVLSGAVRGEVARIDVAAAVSRLRTMDAVVAEFHSPERVMSALLGSFAVIALVMAGLGLYTVVAFTVERRGHEIGIRMALGARPVDALFMILRQGVEAAAVGVGIGLLLAIGATRALSSLLFGVGSMDPATFGFVATTMIVLAVGASIIPARRVIRTDPAVALRKE